MMQNFCSYKTLLPAVLLMTIGQLPALSHPRDSIVNNLIAECTASGDSCSAKFVQVPKLHTVALQLLGRGTAVAKGEATFIGTQFHQVDVFFNGTCYQNLVPASLITRIRFIKPGTTTILDHGYDCARNIFEVLPNGVVHVKITTESVCDCDDMIPPGSTLVGINLELICADPGGRTQFNELVYRLDANGHSVPFDLTAPSASCSE
jgi:hypothetical protein